MVDRTAFPVIICSLLNKKSKGKATSMAIKVQQPKFQDVSQNMGFSKNTTFHILKLKNSFFFFFFCFHTHAYIHIHIHFILFVLLFTVLYATTARSSTFMHSTNGKNSMSAKSFIPWQDFPQSLPSATHSTQTNPSSVSLSAHFKHW